MRIVVVSDTHGNARALRQAVLDQPQAEYIIHLGDRRTGCGRPAGRIPGKDVPPGAGQLRHRLRLAASGAADGGGRMHFLYPRA